MSRHAAAENIVTPKIVTSGFADTSSLDGILAYLIKPGMSDKEKVVAVYNWYRRMVYPGRYMGADRRDLLRMINSYGLQLCGSQAGTLTVIFQKLGLDFRVVSANAGKEFGHTFIEVKYGGAWHVLDTMSSFMVFDRTPEHDICGMDQLDKDPTLLTDAQKEGRVGPEFLLYVRNPEIDYPTRLKITEAAGEKPEDMAWNLMVFDGKNLMDFWTKAIHKGSPSKINDNNGGKYNPGLLDITLRPNETYVRTSEPMGKWLTAPSYTGFPPHNMAGGRNDEFDTVNFPYFAPYKRAGWPFHKYVYRYYANGWLEWRPDLPAGELAASVESAVGLAADPKTGVYAVAAGAPKTRTLTLPFKSPYAVVEIELDLQLTQKGDSARCELVLVEGQRRVAEWKLTGDADGVQKIVLPNKGAACYDGKLGLRLAGDDAAKVALVRTKTWFQLNFMSLPGLLAGENTVTVSAARPAKLADSQLVVTYEWDDGPDWKTPRKDERTIRSFPTSYTLTAEGPNQVARLRRITMANVPVK